MPRNVAAIKSVAQQLAAAKRKEVEELFITRMVTLFYPNREYFLASWHWDDEDCKIIAGRKFRFDFVHSDFPIAVEIDGGTWVAGMHASGTGIARDAEKRNLATAAGYRVYVFTHDMLRDASTEQFLAPLLGDLTDSEKYNDFPLDGPVGATSTEG